MIPKFYCNWQLIGNPEHLEELNSLQDYLISISKKLKEIQKKLLEFTAFPDEYQVCREYCFEKNSQINDLMSKILEYHERFSDKNSSGSSKTNNKSGSSKSSIFTDFSILKIV